MRIFARCASRWKQFHRSFEWSWISEIIHQWRVSAFTPINQTKLKHRKKNHFIMNYYVLAFLGFHLNITKIWSKPKWTFLRKSGRMRPHCGKFFHKVERQHWGNILLRKGGFNDHAIVLKTYTKSWRRDGMKVRIEGSPHKLFLPN